MLQLPSVDAQIGYGTPEMAQAIEDLYQQGALDKQRVIAMLGHKDGILTFGKTVEQAGHALITVLAAAIQQFK
jgi:hypothetical protein